MPPMVQRLCVAGSGAKVRANFQFGLFADAVEDSDAGLDSHGAWRGRPRPMAFMYFEKSRMTAALHACPASEVPAPRVRMGALCLRQRATVAMTSCFVAWDDEADGDVAIVRGVGGVEGA
jgi:hypothetical protein